MHQTYEASRLDDAAYETSGCDMVQVTLKDVGIAAGIHQSAVSRVLRGRDQKLRLSERRRKEIRDVAVRLGYRPNTAAAATVSGKFNSIALVAGTGETTSTLPQGMVYGITDALAEHDKQLVVSRLGDGALVDESQMPLFLRKHSCDGLLLNYTYHVPAGMSELLDRFRIPSIWLNVKQAHDCVHPDDFGAGANATQWLLAQGHRRIAYVDLLWALEEWPAVHYSTRDRHEGYCQAMRAAGLTPCRVAPEARLPRDQRIAHLRHLLDAPDRPTAIVCYGDEASAVFVAAMGLGLSVPQDLEIVTFSERVVDVGGIALPTMRIDAYAMGRCAVGEVLAKIANPRAHRPARAVAFPACPVTGLEPNAPPARSG